MPDHRLNYSVLRLYIVGVRMMGAYTKDHAVSDYLMLHPEASEQDVREELESELLRETRAD